MMDQAASDNFIRIYDTLVRILHELKPLANELQEVPDTEPWVDGLRRVTRSFGFVVTDMAP